MCEYLATVDPTTGIICNDKPKSLISIVPGLILPWAGEPDNVPDGYILCNGDNGTPDLRQRVPVGQKSDNIYFDTLGETPYSTDTIQLDINHLPLHDHVLGWDDKGARETIAGGAYNAFGHSYTKSLKVPYEYMTAGQVYTGGNGQSTLIDTATGGNMLPPAIFPHITGSSGTPSPSPIDNRQPFVYVNFIMKL